MNRTIWKFPLPVADDFTLDMPVGAEILTVQMQHHRPALWAIVSTDLELERRRFLVRGTGLPFSGEEQNYIATWQDGGFVWHLFSAEVKP